LRARCRDRAAFAGTILATLPVQERKMPRPRVLIVYGTTGDSSVDLARRLARALSRAGVPAEAREADEVPDLADYDGVAVEGAREGAGWTSFARDFARRHASALKNLPAWFLPSARGPGEDDGRDQTRWAHAIARWLGGPPAESRVRAPTPAFAARPVPNSPPPHEGRIPARAPRKNPFRR
jgi:hypothetical protein